LSHSHIPVKHLLKQVELYRSKRNNRDVRPEWVTELIDRVAEIFEPLDDVGRVGFDCQLAEDRWCVGLFLGATEIVGGPLDGRARHANFQFDLRRLIGLFSKLEGFTWQALPDGGEDDRRPAYSVINVDGLVSGNPIRLQLFSIAPETAGPGLRQYPDGSCNPA